MVIQSLLNVMGLSLNMVGAYFMFHYSAKVESGTFIYTDAELKQMRQKDKFKNSMVRTGVFLIFIGFICQLASLLLSSLER